MDRFLSTLICGFTLLTILSCGGASRKLLCSAGSTDTNCLLTMPAPTATALPASKLSCSVNASKSSVLNGESITLNISALGGKAPYWVPSAISNFASNTAIPVSFTNTGTTDRVIAHTVQIGDSTGGIASCTVSITVRPQGSAGGLGCSIAASKENISVGETITFTVTASGAADFTFSNLEIQSGWSVQLSKQNGTVANSALVFANPGTRNLTTRVQAAGAEVSCAKVISVSRPNLTVVLNPSSATLPIGDVLLVRAVASGFDSALPINYAFESSEPGISILASGDTAQVRVADGRFHRFDLRVRAFNSSGSAAQSVIVPIQFSSNVLLACEIVPGAMAADGSISFQIATMASFGSVAPFDSLLIEEFNPGPGAVKTSFGMTNPISYRFSGTGLQTVYARARSAISGTPCFGGAAFSRTIRLREELNRCDIVMSPNPSLAGSEVVARVNIPANVGSGNFRLDLTATSASVRPGSSFGEFRVVFPSSGGYPVSARVTDLVDGRFITCGTTQTVQANYETRYVDCSSSSYRYNQCGIGSGTIESLVVNKRYSSSGCSLGYSYGAMAPNTIWVDHGCRARFEVRVRLN